MVLRRRTNHGWTTFQGCVEYVVMDAGEHNGLRKECIMYNVFNVPRRRRYSDWLTCRTTQVSRRPDLLQRCHLNSPRQFRSSISQQRFVLKLSLIWAVTASRIWNGLPVTLISSETIATLRKKTYLFEIR